MLSYIRSVIGTYTPIEGVDGIGSLNVEYIVSAILLILCVWLVFKSILYLFSALFRIKK